MNLNGNHEPKLTFVGIGGPGGVLFNFDYNISNSRIEKGIKKLDAKQFLKNGKANLKKGNYMKAFNQFVLSIESSKIAVNKYGSARVGKLLERRASECLISTVSKIKQNPQEKITPNTKDIEKLMELLPINQYLFEIIKPYFDDVCSKKNISLCSNLPINKKIGRNYMFENNPRVFL